MCGETGGYIGDYFWEVGCHISRIENTAGFRVETPNGGVEEVFTGNRNYDDVKRCFLEDKE